MNEILTFPKIKAWPCNLQDTMALDIFSERECERRIKEEFHHHMDSAFTAHRYDYPKEPKDLYIVPFSRLKESHDLGFRPPKFAMLWLPSVASNILEIREIVPKELRESPIVAWDNNYSIFRGNNVLYMDPGFGEVLFILTTNSNFDYPRDWQFLAELP